MPSQSKGNGLPIQAHVGTLWLVSASTGSIATSRQPEQSFSARPYMYGFLEFFASLQITQNTPCTSPRMLPGADDLPDSRLAPSAIPR